MWTVDARVLGHVGQRLGDAVVGGLDRLGQAPVDLHGQLDRDRGAAGESLERRAQAALGEDRRVDAAGEVAQLVQCSDGFGRESLQLFPQSAGLGWYDRSGDPRAWQG
ncbi:hypothetical protein AB0K15_32630 [Amycolatopsis sp. NPDC049253]|uniref:hypothetical protein n=1 Tax=Amycolatopsis sp. NPDC049253 TaxID=3155274 RepID=UPI003437E64D